MNKEIKIKKVQENPTKSKVLKLIFKISISWIYLGNLIVQYIICETGNTKLIRKTERQKEKAKNDFFPFNLILLMGLNPLPGWWYLASFLE